MMPAVKHFDPVMGVDIHILIVPMVGPVPIPHPHVAMIMDPMDYVPVIGSTVNVGVMPRGTAGTAGKSIPHIPMGAPFSKPPMNESEIFMGSAMVLADGSPMTFTALPVLSCHDIGMISPPRKKPKKTYGMVLPTSMVTAIPAGLPVLVGGPPTIDMMGMAMAGGMKALGGAFGKLRKLQKGSKRMKKVSDAVHKKAKKAMDKLGVPPSVQNKVHKGICSITGHPVDVAAGKLFTDAVDFELPGPLPLKWERTWFSTSVYNGPLGHGWHHNYDVALCLGDKAVAVRMADGRPVGFPLLAVGEAAFQRAERLTLIRDSRGYALDTADDLRYRFFPQPAANGNYLLQSLTEKVSGSTLKFLYSHKAELIEITDSAGRFIRFENDAEGRIKKILLPTPEADSIDNFYCAYEYYYERGELVAAADALQQKTLYRYENHLLTQETLKNGLNFYFKFDGVNHTARCIETWGDGEIYFRRLQYDTQKNITKVYDSHGYLTTYYHDGVIPHQIVDPKGFTTYLEYNTFSQIVKETDPIGRTKIYNYDDMGYLTSELGFGDRSKVYEYDSLCNLISYTDEVGGEWRYAYDAQGRLIEESDPEGASTKYIYSAGMLAEIIDSNGMHFRLHYDQYGNIRRLEDEDQIGVESEFDQLGNLVRIVDVQGNVRLFKYDKLNRWVGNIDPDGNVCKVRYDKSGNITYLEDKQLEVEFEYEGISLPTARIQGGVPLKFEYDTEARLIRVTNELGDSYRYQYDEVGNVIREINFEGKTIEYHRDPLGRVTRMQHTGGRFVEYRYDQFGYVSHERYSDGLLNEFTSRPDGYILFAKNQHAEILFERNLLGYVTKETCNGQWIECERNASGERTAFSTSFGASMTFKRDGFGRVSEIDGDLIDSTIRIQRNQMGLEVVRQVSEHFNMGWKRDALGRPIAQYAEKDSQVFHRAAYAWKHCNRIDSYEVNNEVKLSFKHDAWGSLSSVISEKGKVQLRTSDGRGSLYETESMKDRQYGASGQLLRKNVSQGEILFEHDSDGNLVRKQSSDGGVWRYYWNNAGMLRKVVCPDERVIEFAYDALGRRVSKKVDDVSHCYFWDGNNLMHEWIKPDEKKDIKSSRLGANAVPGNGVKKCETGTGIDSGITWMFEPDSYVPMLRVEAGESHFIWPDQLGIPMAMLDESGKGVWSANIDLWSGAIENPGSEIDCPFRFPGQYRDVETGLHYNRFRYYDPDTGQYISPDPIGLEGGVLPYAYVVDPFIWVDLFGLSGCVALDNNACVALMEQMSNRGAIMRAIGNRRPFVPRTAMREFAKGGGDVKGLKRFLSNRGGGVVSDASRKRVRSYGDNLARNDATIVATARERGMPLLTRDGDVLNRAPDVARAF